MLKLVKLSLFLPLFLLACGPAKQADVAAKPAKVGIVLPLSGTNAQSGKYARDGFELGMEHAIAASGAKAPILDFQDDAGVPARAGSITQQFADDPSVKIIFGAWNSPNVKQQAQVIDQRLARGEDGLVVFAEAQSPDITNYGDFIFRIQPDSRYYLKTLVPFAMDRMKLKRFAILYLNTTFGIPQKTIFEELVRAQGGEIVAAQGFDPGTTNFRTALAQIVAQRPDGIFIPVYNEAGPILKQARELGIDAQFLATSTIENSEVLAVAGAAAESVIYAHHFDPESTDKRIRAFVAAFQKRYGYAPEGYAALAYDAAFIVEKALATSQTRVQVRDFLYAYSGDGVTGPTRFDRNGDVVKPIFIRTVRNGKFTTLK